MMLVMNDKGRKGLLDSKFTLGGDASVAAGPVGRSSSAETDASMRAQILSYSRQRGVFAGIALTGSTLREDDDANDQLYSKKVSNREILSGKVSTPPAGRAFIAALDKYSSRK